jgi:hypothetical protein
MTFLMHESSTLVAFRKPKAIIHIFIGRPLSFAARALEAHTVLFGVIYSPTVPSLLVVDGAILFRNKKLKSCDAKQRP